jgi:hypothetical protein
MVDVAAVMKEFPGAKPLAGLDGCWTWSAGRFYFALALPADGGHALQLNCRDVLDPDLAIAVLAFARARTDAILAGAPFVVLEGFNSTSATPFDCVAAAIPAIARYHEFEHPELDEITYAVFPAYRCEFTGLETQEEATYTFNRVLDAANINRPPSPWVRMRFENPKTGAGSIGPDLGIASADLLMQELRNLEHADNAFVDFENFRHERRRASWSGGLQLSDGDNTRSFKSPDLLIWAHRFIYDGMDSAA